MNDLMTVGDVQTMSSREIAELTGKEHDNVRRDISKMAHDLSLTFEEKVMPSNGGRPSRVFLLNKENTLILVSGYSIKMRAAIIRRWQELESRVNTPALPQNYIQALEALLESEKEKERLALENKEMTPKADVYDRIVERNGLYNATQIAQKFGQSAIWLNKQLASMDVYNRSVKRGRVFQQWFIDKGYGIMRETENGFSQPMFYAEGEMWIVRKLSEEGLI
ncbi:DNA-binding protein [Klebsiella phage vB_KpnM_FZ14]|uniref:DNA-binding protein n=1 Tax=Klebsiella phage vB_KpnM_FZ14 TaxID=2530028 RepID=A0A4D6T847_9CAUD|nr:anti-repressor Ant [Klebsiella phage vB_KpnM_FZ14]QCG76482.1 DNA-binding protein [Klebsiella phage vB_KpnM_FZ14]